MKNLTTLALAIAMISAGVTAVRAEEKEVKSITAESLNTIAVVEKLGVPLGEVATIRAIIVDGDSLRTKADMGSFFLRVTEVNGKKLDSEPIIDFFLAPGSRAKLANDNFELYELKTGKKTGELTGSKIEKLKEDYVGRALLLQVYELGSFSGLPKNLPQEVMVWQDRGFHFRTYLRILREVDAK